MGFSEDWKSFPICETGTISCSSAPARPIFGPLIFNPIPQTLTHLFCSSSLLPLHPLPQLPVSRFLVTSSSDSPVLPSTASSIASLFGSQYQNDLASDFRYNRLEFLKNRDGNNIIVFFPTGVNSEQVGFLLLCVKGSDLCVQLDGNGDVFRTPTGASDRILRISANPVDDLGLGCSSWMGTSSSTIGYLLASTLYTVHWYVVKHNSSLERPSVIYLGVKVFKTCSVAHACWSPHTREEALVLLENGELFLFDLEYHLKAPNSNTNFKGTRLRVPWNESVCSKNKVWLSCEFSCHPRILIVARSDAVFLVDLTLNKCIVSCLMKVEMLHMYNPVKDEQFLAFSRAGSDSFYFTVASSSFLLLCDVRKPMDPVFKWDHHLDRPCFINVFSLSMLRSNSRKDTFEAASKSGFCILLGSFWNCEFNLFFYGSSLQFQKGSIASKLSKMNKTFCACEPPSQIMLSGCECHCGSCLLKEELSKVALPGWINWQMKKEIVLGFGIINSDLASLLCEPDEYGGFALVRLMSSGRLELQRYQASWVPDRTLEEYHDQVLCLNKHLTFSLVNEKYKFPKTFKFLKLNYLHAYLRGNLTEHLFTKLKEPCVNAQEKIVSSEKTESVGQEIFDDLCPVELRFNAPIRKLEPRGLKAYNVLKRQISKWLEGFDSYKEFCIQSKFEKSP